MRKLHTRPRVQRAPSLRPLISGGQRKTQTSGNESRECETVSTRHCERSEAIHLSPRRAMDCFAALAMTWMGRCLLNTRTRGHNNLDCTNTIAALSQIENTSRATPRRTAVEIATCPRQCAVALRSNFCRHAQRMVNPQANVLTSAQTSLADGSWGRVRARFHNDASPCRCDRFAIESAGGYTNVQL